MTVEAIPLAVFGYVEEIAEVIKFTGREGHFRRPVKTSTPSPQDAAHIPASHLALWATPTESYNDKFERYIQARPA